jgi:hypothetical protein
MYDLSVMLVKTGIQKAKNEHPDRTFQMMDTGFPKFS